MLENLDYVESVYARYQGDPMSVSPEWRDFFGVNNRGNNHVDLPEEQTGNLAEKLHELVHNFRARGHLIAAIDPLGTVRPCPPELNLESYLFSGSELDQPLNLPTLHFDALLTIRETFDRLRATYSGSIGVQFMHIDDLAIREWVQRRMESPQYYSALSHAEQLRILTRLTDATIFDEFLRKKFPGAKTFSLEGSETLLPLLDLAIEKAGGQGVQDIVIGMAHRGRLNVLAHIAGKAPCEIFRELTGAPPGSGRGAGDVKYHLGHSAEWVTAGGQKIHLSLCFNPSHLEFVNPIVLGRTRARQDRAGDRDRRQVLSLMIHGDAAFAGEGIVQETLNLSKLAGYEVGGTMHIILNNQIGFTTSPDEGRSTLYATDVARMLSVPIFHVNGEDLEAVAHVLRMALDFRQEFQSDVFVDMYGYRRWGHNETDEPSFTQPVLYRSIQQHKNVRENYLGRLIKSNEVTAEEAEHIAQERQEKLEQELEAAKNDECAGNDVPHGIWEKYSGGPEPADEIQTGVPLARLQKLLHNLTEVPKSFHLHPKLERAMEIRREMAGGGHPVDWAAAEILALATLATEGVNIRLTGQDSARGTFSHRHAIFYDHEDGFPYVPLQNLAEDQAPVEIVNSPLSEAGALGFEYGYSLDCPGGLVLWEAQFGDFINSAQVILDQFITSAESKWQRLSGLVLLLPHGFEGMGAEHSSARIERFLTLAAEDNIQIAQPTTPAQYFHLLRRQALRRWRKPLVIFTPKSLLRHPKVISNLADLSTGAFQRVLPDVSTPRAVKRVLLCTGKIYYELQAYQAEHKRDDTVIIRLEQLYPLPAASLENILQPLAEGTPVLWVQEEPVNMGAWRYLHEKFGRHLFGRLPFAIIGRPESASPATGSSGAHKVEQLQLIERAFSKPPAGHETRNDITKK
ncbi:MAG TPA: 2-oxoglutarate dehydrogenase E1 component [Candidatus Sulfotelmatobacter sp.]|jgi:2-oxoglutarate dehydrogenase E1 component|nr:2-oxoglutarate dehydrogenase E1 component [Candidatus Sulfotelmatobacter sp.]